MRQGSSEGQAIISRRIQDVVLDLARAAMRRRRVRLWAVTLALVVVALALPVAQPDWHWLADMGINLPPLTVLLVFLAALCCEYVDSSLGMGYGTTLTPILLAAGFEPLQIVPCVLLSECLTGVTAGVMHHRDGNVDLLRDRKARGTAILLSILSTVGAIVAVALAIRISKTYLTAGIGTIILLMGVVIVATIRRQLRYRPKHLIAIGAVAAFNKGLSGGGYGPLVTAGQVVSGVGPKQAVGITSLAEGLTSLVGVLAYVIACRHLDWSLAVPLAAGALLSVPIATLTVRRLPEGVIRGVVGVLTIALGLLTLSRLLLR